MTSGPIRLTQGAIQSPNRIHLTGLSLHPSGVERPSILYDRVNGSASLEQLGQCVTLLFFQVGQ